MASRHRGRPDAARDRHSARAGGRGLEAVGHGEDGVEVRRAALQHAVAIGECAVGRGQRHDGAALPMKRAHGRDRFAHFLAIGANVLDGRRARQTGNAAQALEPRPAALDRMAHHRVPWLARPGRQLDRRACRDRRKTAQAHPDHEAVDALVGDDQVRAAAQDSQRDAARPGPPPGRKHVCLVVSVGEEARRPADAQGAMRSQRLMLARRHGGSILSHGPAE